MALSFKWEYPKPRIIVDFKSLGEGSSDFIDDCISDGFHEDYGDGDGLIKLTGKGLDNMSDGHWMNTMWKHFHSSIRHQIEAGEVELFIHVYQ